MRQILSVNSVAPKCSEAATSIGQVHWSITILLHQLDHTIYLSNAQVMEKQSPSSTQSP